jgi:hypothetical protein
MGSGLGTELSGGVALIVVAVVMIYFGRPKAGEDKASSKAPGLLAKFT